MATSKFLHPVTGQFIGRPAEVISTLTALLAARSLTLKLDWKWVGRNRHGVIYIFDAQGFCVYEKDWARQQTRWADSDADLTSCYTGSPKHIALVDAVAAVQALGA